MHYRGSESMGPHLGPQLKNPLVSRPAKKVVNQSDLECSQKDLEHFQTHR